MGEQNGIAYVNKDLWLELSVPRIFMCCVLVFLYTFFWGGVAFVTQVNYDVILIIFVMSHVNDLCCI